MFYRFSCFPWRPDSPSLIGLRNNLIHAKYLLPLLYLNTVSWKITHRLYDKTCNNIINKLFGFCFFFSSMVLWSSWKVWYVYTNQMTGHFSAIRTGLGHVLMSSIPTVYSPSKWHLLPQSHCGGDRQSPINIERKNAMVDKNLGGFTFTHFNDKHAIKTITNTGHTGIKVFFHIMGWCCWDYKEKLNLNLGLWLQLWQAKQISGEKCFWIQHSTPTNWKCIWLRATK